jgi:MFS family permease
VDAEVYQADWISRFRQVARGVARPDVWRVPANVWGLGVTSLLTDISSEMIVSILPVYLVVSAGMAPAALGLVTGLQNGGPMMAAWLGGFIADRSGRRKLTAGAGYLISALCRLGWLFFPGQSVPAVTSLIVGDRVGKAVRTAPRDAMISLSTGPRQLATAFGIHRALDAAGAAIGPLLAFVLLWRLPRRYDVVFVASFAAALLGLAALALLVDFSADGKRGVRSGRTAWKDAIAALADPPLRRILALALLFGLFTVGDALIYLLLTERSHAAAYWIPLFYTGTAISFLILAPPIGVIADQIGRRRVYVIAHIPLVAAYLVALTGPSSWPWNAVLCVALLGGYYAAADGVLTGLASGVLPADTRATGLAWVATIASVASLCASVGFGWLWTSLGDLPATALFSTALAGLMIVSWWGSGVEESPA